MAKSDFKSVEEYIAAQPEAIRGMLAQVRKAIRDSVPAADEVISYKIPTYKLAGELVLYFAGWKQHISLYPATGRLLAKFNDELEPYKIHKATIRFPISQPVPVKLIARIAKFRAREVAQKQKKSAKS
jgi:uncharacterized protein YdhG (YjbR/CyaY superfamily)